MGRQAKQAAWRQQVATAMHSGDQLSLGRVCEYALVGKVDSTPDNKAKT